MDEKSRESATTTVQANASCLENALENLGRMMDCYRRSLAEGTKDAMLLAVCREAITLLAKLRAMHKRWQVLLPFKEAADVDFAGWHKRVDEWSKELGRLNEAEEYPDTAGTSPDNLVLLDLVLHEEPEAVALPELEGEGLDHRIGAFCKNMDHHIRLWRRTVEHDDWDLLAADYLKNMRPTDPGTDEEQLHYIITRHCHRGDTIYSAWTALTDLAHELKRIDAFFCSRIRPQQFTALALRLKHRYCLATIEDGHRELMRTYNTWQANKRKARAEAMKDGLKTMLISAAEGKDLMDYIDMDNPDLYGDACFGQYLFKHRHTLTVDTVRQTVKLCHQIAEINRMLDPKGTARKKKEAALGRETTERERTILGLLKELAAKGEWRGGATADSVVLGLGRMLGVGYMLEPDMQPLSDLLWQMLKSRKGCDADKSLRVTWLNIVGWCVKEELIAGGGPTLCEQFFPGLHDPDAYKAIDKGRKAPSKMFAQLHPLLKKFLK
ncbi:MAG: hypothetical protein ACI3X9_01840 [Bacteroidaceae bacterium]